MMNAVNYSLFPNEELYTFALSTLTFTGKYLTGIVAIAPFHNTAMDAFLSYQNALERERKNPFTVVLATKDAERDAAFMALRLLAEAATFRNKEGWHDAAIKITDIFRKHGWSAPSMGYKTETSVIANLIGELKNRCTAELELIGATAWLAELETTQQAFEAAFQQSIAQKPAAEPTIWDTRPQLCDALRSLLSIVALLAKATPTPDTTTLTSHLNELISRSLSTVKASNTRSQNEKEEANKPTEQPS